MYYRTSKKDTIDMNFIYAKIASKKFITMKLYFDSKISRMFILIGILTENKRMFDTSPDACTDENTLPCSQNMLPLPQPSFLECTQCKHSLKLSMSKTFISIWSLYKTKYNYALIVLKEFENTYHCHFELEVDWEEGSCHILFHQVDRIWSKLARTPNLN